MTDQHTDRWNGIDWAKAELELIRIQKRISNAAQRGNHAQVLQLQRLLLNSFSARALAVRWVTEKKRGKRTPGVDGVHTPTSAQKSKLAIELDLSRKPLPLRRIKRPKDDGTFRKLSIPTIHDRAVQRLIALSLEPQWEHRLPPHMYGFRRGRGVHDAVYNIRGYISRIPKWVLDADIAVFFDNVDREHLMGLLDTLPCIKRTIARMLRSGYIENFDWEASHKGIPQGGPLSPLLANILLAGIEGDLNKAFPPARRIGGTRVRTIPRIVIYADDFVVLHVRRDVIEEVLNFLTDWLAMRGLHLNREKTRITHTLTGTVADPGFDFLGYHFQQWTKGPQQYTPWSSGIQTLITPSPKTIKRFKTRLAEVIERYHPNQKRNAEFRRRQQEGGPGLQESLINELNPRLRGWANHFRHGNSKKTFGDFDHWLWRKLWQWTKRHYGKRKTRHQLVMEFFNGAKPWTFKVRDPASGKPTELTKLSSVKIRNYSDDGKYVRASAHYYDGDWIAWARRRGHYPGIPKSLTRAVRDQKAKCAHCGRKFEPGQRLTLERRPHREGRGFTTILKHTSCVTHPNKGRQATDDKGPSL